MLEQENEEAATSWVSAIERAAFISAPNSAVQPSAPPAALHSSPSKDDVASYAARHAAEVTTTARSAPMAKHTVNASHRI